jgi:hypothetical protein
MNLIPTPRWIMDEWFFNPKILKDETIMEEKSTQLQVG